MLLRSTDKHEALQALVRAASHGHPGISSADALTRIEAREKQVSTLIAAGVALPHARLPQLAEPIVAVGLHRSGIPWQVGSPDLAKLIVLVLGSERDPTMHIRLLADIARLVREDARRKSMLSAPTARALYEAFTGPEPAVTLERLTDKDRVTCRLLSHAAELTKDTAGAHVLVHDDGDLNPAWLEVFGQDTVLIVSTRDTEKYAGIESPAVKLLRVPAKGMAPKYRVELAVLLAVSQGLIERHATVINVYGGSGLGGLDALSIVDIGQVFQDAPCLSGDVSGADIDHQVLNRVLSIALSLASEGREGKPVGTIFVLGDCEEVSRRSSQIVINPFKGYPEDERNILDPSLEETVKEFAAIDGAFLLRGDGVIMAAGTCLQTDPESSSLLSGLGTRHVAAMSITAHTKALSVVISQSTGAVRIFKGGKEILLLDRAGR